MSRCFSSYYHHNVRKWEFASLIEIFYWVQQMGENKGGSCPQGILLAVKVLREVKGLVNQEKWSTCLYTAVPSLFTEHAARTSKSQLLCEGEQGAEEKLHPQHPRQTAGVVFETSAVASFAGLVASSPTRSILVLCFVGRIEWKGEKCTEYIISNVFWARAFEPVDVFIGVP